jgi:hypothetical protein
MTSYRPWHVPVVGAIAVLWTSLSALDYLLTRFEVGPYLALFTQEQADYFLGLPFWLDALWAVAVWSGVAGALSLVAGLRLSALLLGIAALAMALLTLGLVFLNEPPLLAVTGPVGLWVMLGSSAIHVLLWFYARKMHAEGRVP